LFEFHSSDPSNVDEHQTKADKENADRVTFRVQAQLCFSFSSWGAAYIEAKKWKKGDGFGATRSLNPSLTHMSLFFFFCSPCSSFPRGRASQTENLEQAMLLTGVVLGDLHYLCTLTARFIV